MKKSLLLIASHVLAVAAGFALGIYALPILTAPPAPSAAEIASQTNKATFTGQFRRDLKDSDLIHWGEGTVSVSQQSIALLGRLAPGPDYKLYLSPEFVERGGLRAPEGTYDARRGRQNFRELRCSSPGVGRHFTLQHGNRLV